MTSDDDQCTSFLYVLDVSHLNEEQGSGAILREMMHAAVASFESKMPCRLEVVVSLAQLGLFSAVPTDFSSTIHEETWSIYGGAWSVILRLSWSLHPDSEAFMMGFGLGVPSDTQATEGEGST